MTKKNRGQEKRVVGKIVLEFTENTDGNWYCKVVPVMLALDIRDKYKLALVTADLQVHVNKTLGFVDTIIKTKAEVIKIHNDLVANKEKVVADIDKLQTKLPFEDEPDA